MTRRPLLIAACALFLLGQTFAHGQRETERFIPIGRSPGASGVTTRIGTVQSADARSRTFELETPEGRHKVAVPADAPIWLDRSRQRQSALDGSFDDLQPGRRAEVRYASPARAGLALWIKVETMQ
jgi:hypothetical protein